MNTADVEVTVRASSCAFAPPGLIFQLRFVVVFLWSRIQPAQMMAEAKEGGRNDGGQSLEGRRGNPIMRRNFGSGSVAA